jgi:hypothetical protein
MMSDNRVSKMEIPVTTQVHDKFKVFTGKLAADKTIGKLADEVAAFAKKSKVAAKSIGVEYLESVGQLLITLGYRDDAEPYAIKLHSIPLGKVDALAKDFSALEKAMATASTKHRNIICHELYVTGDRDFILVLMTHG